MHIPVRSGPGLTGELIKRDAFGPMAIQIHHTLQAAGYSNLNASLRLHHDFAHDRQGRTIYVSDV